MKTITMLLALLLVLGPHRLAPAADDASAALQKGLFEEEANHNLDAAIKAYQAVVDATDAQRRLAATAVFRLGECYRKLGQTNAAVAQYQRLLRDFADQTNLVALSRQNLAGFGAQVVGPEAGADTRASVLERELAEQEAGFTRLRAVYSQMTNLSRVELKKAISTFVPDLQFTDLLGAQSREEQQLAAMRERYAPDHPEVKAAVAMLNKVEQQINERMDGILAGLKAKMEAKKAEVEALRRELDHTRADTAKLVRSTATVVDPVQVKLLQEEVKLVEQQIAEVQRRFEYGKATADELRQQQRDLLSLKRMLPENAKASAQQALIEQEIKLVEAGLAEFRKRLEVGSAAPIDEVPLKRALLALQRDLAAVTSATQPATDAEEKELKQLQAIIRDSPDLFNVGLPGGTTRLQVAVEASHVKVAEFLLANGADVNDNSRGKGTPLHLAAEKGHKSMVELLLRHGAQVNNRDTYGTPLHYAVENGHKAVAEVLLANKANVNAKGNGRHVSGDFTPLHLAAFNGFTTIAELLLAKGAQVNATDGSGQTPLHYAATYGHFRIAQLLLTNQAEVNIRSDDGRTPLLEAVKNNRLPIARLLVENHAKVNVRVTLGNFKDWTPLHFAAENSDGAMTEMLLAHKSAVDAFSATSQTPLLIAIGKKKADVVEALLKAKANPNLASISEGNKGWTPLHYAVASTNKAVTELLLKGGASPNAQLGTYYRGDAQRGYTPLLIATTERSLELVKLLLDYKADPNLKTEASTTPLDRAISNKDKEMVETLLKHGAEVNSQGYDGDTSLTQAVASGNRDILELLIRHGADVNAPRTDGLTPLHVAVGKNNKAAMDLLLAAKADPNAVDPQGRTPLDYVKRDVKLGQSSTPGIAPRLPAPTVISPPPFSGELSLPPSEPALNPRQAEWAAALRQGGASEWAPRPNQIALTRRSVGVHVPVLFKGTNEWNEFEVLDLIASYDWRDTGLTFPDFTKLVITRRLPSGELTNFPVSLAARFGGRGGAAGFKLAWGDQVEVPVSEHKLTEAWYGLAPEVATNIAKGLERKVTVTVKNQAKTLTLTAQLTPYAVGSSDNVVAIRIPVPEFRLKSFLLKSGLLLTTSDLTRIKVRRTTATGERRESVFDITREVETKDDLWLRDGDVIEVPEK